MTQFEFLHAGGTEAQQKIALAWLMDQVSLGKARTGVVAGLLVSQTGTPSTSVQIQSGAAMTQNAVLDGASLLVNDSTATLDVLGPNPMAGVGSPRWDLIVFDNATRTIRAITGTPSGTPVDPATPATAAPLARLRHAANATTIPSSAIDDLRTSAGFTSSLLDARLDALEADSGNLTNILTASSGWSIAVQTARKIGRVVTLTFAVQRTGATISGTSDGNLTNVQIASAAAGWRPPDDIPISGGGGNAGVMWSGYLNESGVLAIGALSPNQSVATGDTLTGGATFLAVN